ncbi:MAG: hypothetical protein ABSG05_00020 [Candidatus Pacearchaeota archaeon]|jgi:hypothetical protein
MPRKKSNDFFVIKKSIFLVFLCLLLLIFIFFVLSRQNYLIKNINQSLLKLSGNNVQSNWPVYQNESEINIPSNWTTYQDKRYEFELRIPPGWTEKNFQQLTPNQYYFAIQAPDSATANVKPFEKQNLGVIVQIFEPSLFNSTEDRTCEKVYTGDQKNCITQYIYIGNGIKAIEKTYQVPDLGYTNITAKDIDFVQNNTFFHFYTSSYSYGEPIQNLSNKELYLDEIMSTFKFVST